jgi:hypothetical protein
LRKSAVTNHLDIAILHRRGESSRSGFTTERWSIDFLVDGHSLSDLLNAGNLDRCGVFLAAQDGLPRRSEVNAETHRLFANVGSSATRLPLYVCPECGDLGCGALTCDVRCVGDKIMWSRFGFENDYDDAMSDFISYDTIGPFEFDARQYTAAIERAAAGRV